MFSWYRLYLEKCVAQGTYSSAGNVVIAENYAKTIPLVMVAHYREAVACCVGYYYRALPILMCRAAHLVKVFSDDTVAVKQYISNCKLV